MGPVEAESTGALRCIRAGNRANTLSKTPLMKSDGQQKQPLILPQRNTRGGGWRGREGAQQRKAKKKRNWAVRKRNREEEQRRKIAGQGKRAR